MNFLELLRRDGFQSPSSSSSVLPLPGHAGMKLCPGPRKAPRQGSFPAPSPAPASLMKGKSPSHMVLGCRWVKAGCPSLVSWQLQQAAAPGLGRRWRWLPLWKSLRRPNVIYGHVLGSSVGAPDNCLPQNHPPAKSGLLLSLFSG